jgi:hypothetical protein
VEQAFRALTRDNPARLGGITCDIDTKAQEEGLQ